jgi:hypothetical protein
MLFETYLSTSVVDSLSGMHGCRRELSIGGPKLSEVCQRMIYGLMIVGRGVDVDLA